MRMKTISKKIACESKGLIDPNEQPLPNYERASLVPKNKDSITIPKNNMLTPQKNTQLDGRGNDTKQADCNIC